MERKENIIQFSQIYKRQCDKNILQLRWGEIIMEQIEFTFDEATPLQKFINKYRDQVVGHTLKAVYIEYGLYVHAHNASTPVFLILDNLCIGIEYLFRGHITIFSAEESDFEITGEESGYTKNKKIVFHSRISNRDDEYLTWCSDMPCMNQKVTDIMIGRHSERYEDYPNSWRPEGGDYFSWLQIKLEDGSILNIYAEDAESDGYTDAWLTDMPAYSSIKTELDKTPWDLFYTIREGFDRVVWSTNPTPDELAELAMYYMRKCDHEIENYRKENKFLSYRSLYSFQLNHVIEQFKIRGMNIEYVDSD